MSRSRARTNRGIVHQDWLSQVETDGPFLALPVLKDMWPNGVERLGDSDERLVRFKEEHAAWERAFDRPDRDDADRYAAEVREWVSAVLLELAEWGDHFVDRADLPADLSITSPGEHITVTPDGALRGRSGEAEFACLVRYAQPTESLHAPGFDGWSASEIDRMAGLLRKAKVPVGIVTDGRWWALVWAGEGAIVGSGAFDALTWREEREVRDAFLTLVNARSFRAKNAEQRLPRLFERSVLEAEEITEALGTQVRKSVELLIQSFSESRLAARSQDADDPLTDDPHQIYQSAVTIMMRVVFLLFAEERGMLPAPDLYRRAYGVSGLLDVLQERVQLEGEESLDRTFDVWHRLLAVSAALFHGANFDDVRMPAYGGSLFDPERFPWLAATTASGGVRLRVSDRVMWHVLESVQVARVSGEARRISFRDIDVEQIGYIYEGLLGYTCRVVEAEAIVGLKGREGEEPEVDLETLTRLNEEHGNAMAFAAALLAWLKENQPSAKPSTAAQLVKQYAAEVDEAEMNRVLRPVVAGDDILRSHLVYWSNLIRRDLRGLPYVVPEGGLIVAETPSRKNAGAHYTPRSLAEEVVLHALQPLVYEPGPLQTNDESVWRLKSSSAILDLKVADIAAGSGAFLVAAARYLAARLVEAWAAEGLIQTNAQSGSATGDVQNTAIREVIAHCLYGADINEMAVEMCKLSLWLVSLDPSKPFSFVDDKIFCGNSLLGLTSVDQLLQLHIDPARKRKFVNKLVDVEGVLQEATRIRKAIASPVDEGDPQRSRNGKRRLLEQSDRVTATLRDMADSVIATALRMGGRPGPQLDDVFKVLEGVLAEAYPSSADGDRRKLDMLVSAGLSPSVPTDYQRWEPVHWVVEAPEVVLERGGFDAVIGNPPFLGDKKLRGALGVEFREYLSQQIAGNVRGGADLVAYFFLRAYSLLRRDGGCLGLIATNTVAQGDTREVGLLQLTKRGFTITRAIQSRPWPASSANLEFAAVWGTNSPIGRGVSFVADGAAVKRISSLLEPEGLVQGDPYTLPENSGVSFIGSYVLGKGFVLSPGEAAEMFKGDPRNREVILPYLNGDDLNSSPCHQPSRYVINFGRMSEAEARKYVQPFQRVERLVKPERMKVTQKDNREWWWRFARTRPALYGAIGGLEQVIVIAQVSKTLMPVLIETGPVLDSKLVVFADDRAALLAVLSSGAHRFWALKYGTTMRVDATYTPRTCFETFPLPALTPRLKGAGEALDSARRELMSRRSLGLTSLYTLINDAAVRDSDIGLIRALHVEIDKATMDAYGWSDIVISQGFFEYKKVIRFGCDPSVRVEILDRLLLENHRRAARGGQMVPEQESLF